MCVCVIIALWVGTECVRASGTSNFVTLWAVETEKVKNLLVRLKKHEATRRFARGKFAEGEKEKIEGEGGKKKERNAERRSEGLLMWKSHWTSSLHRIQWGRAASLAVYRALSNQPPFFSLGYATSPLSFHEAGSKPQWPSVWSGPLLCAIQPRMLRTCCWEKEPMGSSCNPVTGAYNPRKPGVTMATLQCVSNISVR